MKNMEDTLNQDARLIPFLRNLADSIEQKELVPVQLQSIGEFFMAYQFQKQAISDNTEISHPDVREFNQQDVLKFIILGWYIYNVILTDDTIVPTTDSAL